MKIETRFELNQRIVDKATKQGGTIVAIGADSFGTFIECAFDVPIFGRRRHSKRETEIKLEPKNARQQKRKRREKPSK